MYKTIVINLPERTERLERMRTYWTRPFEVVPGIRHPMPHSGCGLAHIAAIRRGLEDPNTPFCLVLEDDVRLKDATTFDDLFSSIQEIAKYVSSWDVVVLGAQHDSTDPESVEVENLHVTKVHPNHVICQPTSRLISTQSCVWSRSALPLLDEYEAALTRGLFLPIDRLVFNNRWSPDDKSTWETCLEINRKIPHDKMPPACSWTPPRCWIRVPPITTQDTEFFSDHTGEQNEDLTTENAVLFSGLSMAETIVPDTRTPRPLAIHVD